MKNLIFITPFFVFIFMFSAHSFAQTFIKAEIDKVSLATNEAVTYKLTITSSERQLPPPQLPKFEGFKVVSTTKVSNISFAKNKVKTITVYTFILYPNEIGKVKIEPSSIKIKEKTYQTEEFQIEVIQVEVKPQVPPEQKPLLPKQSPSELEQSQTTL